MKKFFIFFIISFLVAGCFDSDHDSSDNGETTTVRSEYAYLTDSTGSVSRLDKVVTTDGDSATTYEVVQVQSLQNIGARSVAAGSLYILAEAGTNLRRMYKWDGTTLSQVGGDFADDTGNWTLYPIDGYHRVVVGGQVITVASGAVENLTLDAGYRTSTLWACPKLGNRYHDALFQDGQVVRLDSDDDSTMGGCGLPPSASCIKYFQQRLFVTSGNDLVELDPETFVKVRDVLTGIGSMHFAAHPEDASRLLVLAKSDGRLLSVNPDSTNDFQQLAVLGAGYRSICTKNELLDTSPRLRDVPELMTPWAHSEKDYTIRYQEADGQDLTLEIQKTSNPPGMDGYLVFKTNGLKTISLEGNFAYKDLVLTATGGDWNDTEFSLSVKDKDGNLIRSFSITVRGS